MKSTALLIMLSAATMAFAQSAPPPDKAPAPDKLFQPPQQQAPHTFRFFPHGQKMFDPDYVQPAKPAMQLNTDKGMIHRPPKGSFAQQTPRSPLRPDLYPDLRLLPTETARLEPIPITWPDFKMEPLPITWPKMKAVPVESGAAGESK